DLQATTIQGIGSRASSEPRVRKKAISPPAATDQSRVTAANAIHGIKQRNRLATMRGETRANAEPCSSAERTTKGNAISHRPKPIAACASIGNACAPLLASHAGTPLLATASTKNPASANSKSSQFG